MFKMVKKNPNMCAIEICTYSRPKAGYMFFVFRSISQLISRNGEKRKTCYTLTISGSKFRVSLMPQKK